MCIRKAFGMGTTDRIPERDTGDKSGISAFQLLHTGVSFIGNVGLKRSNDAEKLLCIR